MEIGEPLCLLIADIDHFKKFNDTYGHQIGDQVLRLVAHTLSESVKGRDTPARYRRRGIRHRPAADAHRGRDGARRSDPPDDDAPPHRAQGHARGSRRITLSIGASCYRPGEPVVEIVRRADAALYHAKHNGRNRVASEDGRREAAAAPTR